MASPFFIQEDPKLKRERRLAEIMAADSMSGAPVKHWMQGVGRLAQAWAGKRINDRVDAEMENRQKSAQETLARAMADPVEPLNGNGPLLNESRMERIARIMAANPDTAERGFELQTKNLQHQQNRADKEKDYLRNRTDQQQTWESRQKHLSEQEGIRYQRTRNDQQSDYQRDRHDDLYDAGTKRVHDKSLAKIRTRSSTPTASQASNNAEIDQARQAITGLDPQEIRSRTQEYSDTGRVNSQYDRYLSGVVSKALQRKVGPDEEYQSLFQSFHGDKTPPKETPPGGKAEEAPKLDGKPPMEGARKARDGKWYVPDPKRPGKYMRVVQ